MESCQCLASWLTEVVHDRIFFVLRSAPAPGNMATLEDDDEMVLISADELDEMHRPMPSDDMSAEAEPEDEGEEDELKGTALDDYLPSDPGELELQKGTYDTFVLSL